MNGTATRVLLIGAGIVICLFVGLVILTMALTAIGNLGTMAAIVAWLFGFPISDPITMLAIGAGIAAVIYFWPR